MRTCGCAQEVSVKTALLDNLRLLFKPSTRIRQRIELRHFSAVAQRDGNGILGMARGYDRRDNQLAFDGLPAAALFVNSDLHQVASQDAKLFSKSRTH